MFPRHRMLKALQAANSGFLGNSSASTFVCGLSIFLYERASYLPQYIRKRAGSTFAPESCFRSYHKGQYSAFAPC